MKVDVYGSNAKPSYNLIVPAGTDLSLSEFPSEVAEAVKALQPLDKRKGDVDLTSFCCGDLLAHLQRQLQEYGAGLEKTEVRFSEVVQR